LAYTEVVKKLASTAEALAAASQNTGFLLQRAHRRLRAALNEALRPLDLAIAHVGVLGLLSARGDLSQQQLIEILEVDKSSMVYLIDELEKQGLAERRPAPGDRRAHAVRLTRAGRQRLIAAGEIVIRTESEFLKPLTAVGRARLNQLLRDIT